MCAGGGYYLCVQVLTCVCWRFCVEWSIKEPTVGVKAQPLVLRVSDGEISRESCEIKSVN